MPKSSETSFQLDAAKTSGTSPTVEASPRRATLPVGNAVIGRKRKLRLTTDVAVLKKPEPNKTSGTSPTPAITPRGLRIEAAAQYTGLSPFYLEECARNGTIPAVGGPKSGVCGAYIFLREYLDEYLDGLEEQAVKRAEERRKATAKAAA